MLEVSDKRYVLIYNILEGSLLLLIDSRARKEFITLVL